jgi:hypothetical protein
MNKNQNNKEIENNIENENIPNKQAGKNLLDGTNKRIELDQNNDLDDLSDQYEED